MRHVTCGLRLLLALTSMVVVLATFAVTQVSAPTAFAAYATGHDNTTAPHSWTHADPNTGDPPGNGKLGSNYYYLKTFAIGPEVVCTVFSGGNWEIALEDGAKHVLAHEWPLTSGGQVSITNAHIGSLYMCRISDLGTTPLRDYAQLDSGPIGQVSCGGPGPIIDPNWDAAPMQPVPNSQISCATLAPYTPGDPRLAPPPTQTFDLGGNAGNPTYALTTSATCDLTAATFFGSQGRTGTLTITNATGAVVNGAKWGAQTPNPRTMNQEFVGADAGVQPPGVYRVHFAGPGNGHHLYAICQGV